MADDREQPEAAWATIVAQARTLQGHPDSTIKPRDKSLGTTGRGILDHFLGDTLGETLGGATKLELGPVIGEGGMGVVRLATQATMGRDVAVKSLRAHQRKPGPTLKLLQEAWTAARLEHPNIVPVYDITVDADGSPLIVLKRIEGESLAKVLSDPERARARYGVVDLLEWHLQVLSTICNAIHFAHSRGLVHLDLKPENVMLGSHGEVYVVDWGIAMALEDDGNGRLPLVTNCHEIIGTPSYMAPEMLLGDGAALGVHTDIYLLGAMLYELLAGTAPHRGETLMEVMHAALTSEPELPADTPTELANICRLAMAREPSERPASADALRRELQGFLRHRESDRMATRAAERLAALAQVLDADSTAQTIPRDELFGQARFGFEQALASWPDNPTAREGLTRATRMMVEYELEHGDPQVAATLAGRAEGLPPELIERVARAVERRRANLDELAQRRRDQDLSIGQRTRVFIFSILGAVWTTVPFLMQFVFEHGDHIDSWAYLGLPIVSLVILGGLRIWARDSLTRTRVNRVMVATLALTMTAQLMLMLGGMLLGLSYYTSMAILPLLLSVLVAMVALTVEPRATPIAIAYAIGFFAASALPDWRFLVIGVCNLVFVAVVVIVWRPQRMRGPITEIDHRS